MNKMLITQSCLTFCDPKDCSPPGSSVGFLGQECWSGLSCPHPGNLPDPGKTHVSRTAGRVFYHLSHQSSQAPRLTMSSEQPSKRALLLSHFTAGQAEAQGHPAVKGEARIQPRLMDSKVSVLTTEASTPGSVNIYHNYPTNICSLKRTRYRSRVCKTPRLYKLFPRCPRPHLNLLGLTMELALGVPPRQGVGRREGEGESIWALLPHPKRREVQPHRAPGGGEGPSREARAPPGLGQCCRSSLHQILSPSAPISLGSHSPPCPSLQVHFQGALASSPLQACRPGVGLLWPQQRL